MISNLKKNIYWILLSFVVFLGFVLRLKGLIANPSMWHDECALAWNILEKNYVELFGKLRFLQVAPPMFLIVSKLLVSIFHVKNHIFACDFVLRLIPFFFGSLSIVMFYFVCKSLFKSKWTTLIAILLFCLNPVLINYSFEFKPYILDVFCTLSALWIFLNTDFQKNSTKKILIYGCILAILPWFSFMSIIVIFAGFMALSFKRENPKNFFLMFVPIFLSAFLYLKIYVLNIYSQCSAGMIGFWQNEFVKRDLSNLTQLNMENLHYFFSNLPLFSCTLLSLLMFVGLILMFKDRNWRFILISVLTQASLIIASILHVYPYSRRLIIFLIPFILIFSVKIFDIKNKILAGILLTLIIIPHLLFTVNFVKIQNLNKDDFAREMMIKMTEEITPDETIVINESSNAEFCYYNLFFNLKHNKVFLKPQNKSEIAINTALNKLTKGKYWFYMPYDYNPNQNEIKTMSEWAKAHANVDIKVQATQSTLIRLSLD